MIIWPAIDIRGGKCVRLVQGDYQRERVYGHDPADMADRWVSEGARQLHVVDLDGARDGDTKNRDAIIKIVKQTKIPIQVGGGIRSEETIESYLAIGVQRIVVGTMALKNPTWFKQMCEKYPNRLVAGIDARDGLVATDGWLQTSQTPATDFAKDFSSVPLAGIVYTDISRDGMLKGPNVEAVREMIQCTKIPVIASGGVTVADDVALLAKTGAAGCIVGRSLYEGKMTVAEAIAAAKVDFK